MKSQQTTFGQSQSDNQTMRPSIEAPSTSVSNLRSMFEQKIRQQNEEKQKVQQTYKSSAATRINDLLKSQQQQQQQLQNNLMSSQKLSPQKSKQNIDKSVSKKQLVLQDNVNDIQAVQEDYSNDTQANEYMDELTSIKNSSNNRQQRQSMAVKSNQQKQQVQKGDVIKGLASVFEKGSINVQNPQNKVDQSRKEKNEFDMKALLNQKARKTTLTNNSSGKNKNSDMHVDYNDYVKSQKQKLNKSSNEKERSTEVINKNIDNNKPRMNRNFQDDPYLDLLKSDTNDNSNSQRSSQDHSKDASPINNTSQRTSVQLVTERGNQFIEEYVPITENMFRKKDETIQQQKRASQQQSQLQQQLQQILDERQNKKGQLLNEQKSSNIVSLSSDVHNQRYLQEKQFDIMNSNQSKTQTLESQVNINNSNNQADDLQNLEQVQNDDTQHLLSQDNINNYKRMKNEVITTNIQQVNFKEVDSKNTSNQKSKQQSQIKADSQQSDQNEKISISNIEEIQNEEIQLRQHKKKQDQDQANSQKNLNQQKDNNDANIFKRNISKQDVKQDSKKQLPTLELKMFTKNISPDAIIVQEVEDLQDILNVNIFEVQGKSNKIDKDQKSNNLEQNFNYNPYSDILQTTSSPNKAISLTQKPPLNPNRQLKANSSYQTLSARSTFLQKQVSQEQLHQDSARKSEMISSFTQGSIQNNSNKQTNLKSQQNLKTYTDISSKNSKTGIQNINQIEKNNSIVFQYAMKKYTNVFSRSSLNKSAIDKKATNN